MSTTKPKVLVVEDDAMAAHAVVTLLSDNGYETAHFYEANAALEWLKTHKVELVISDLSLPGITGMQFCKLLKENPLTVDLPVIMLTGMADEAHKVEGLKTGADDYIVKPLPGKEFMARVEALLRRCQHQGHTDRAITSGDLSVNLDTGDVSLKKKPIELNPKEYALLVMFLKKSGRILTYGYIAEEVWGLESVATKDTIKVTIHRLREKLGAYGDCVEPVPGQGYKWNEVHS
ncbi:MAG: response regulator transcription factor [Elusimicrobiales bacterium]|jgi:two-component system phosphate regulon response regulator PhoB